MAQNIPSKQKLNGKHFGQNSVWGVGEEIAILSDASHVKIEQQYLPDHWIRYVLVGFGISLRPLL